MSDAIRVEHVSKVYARFAVRRQFATLKSALLRGSILRDLRPEASFRALEDVNLVVPKGATVAVIGPNGSGKSTLLKVLAGVLKPTSGRVVVTGRTAALLELGTGFHPEVSGRENVIINGMMLGLGRREMERKLTEIVRFAELEEFIDAPVKTYSSGMYARLAFSVAVAVEPDVLLVDEILAVGDEAFSHRCLGRFLDFKREGRTIVFVTHGLAMAESLADAVVLIERGRITAEGLAREVVDRYRGHVHGQEDAAAAADNRLQAGAAENRLRAGEASAPEPPPAAADPAAAAAADPAVEAEPIDEWKPRRWGSGGVTLEDVTLRAKDGQPAALFHTGETLLLEMEAVAHEPQTDFVFGVAVRARDGRLVYGTNTDIERFVPARLEGRSRIRLEFPALALLEGSYALDVAVHRKDGSAFDYRHGCLHFEVRGDLPEVGVVRLDHAWRFEGGVALAPSRADAARAAGKR